MARPREFDEETVLDAATLCFWTRGYEGASTRDLAEQMGITGASLYNAYGDKRALYRLVLDRYANQALAWCAGALTTARPAGEALEAFFTALGAEALNDDLRRGCLVVNAGLETAPSDPEFRQVAADVFVRIEGLFAACVARGQADGSIGADQPAEDLARLLLGAMLGLRVLARTRAERPLVDGMVRSIAALVRA
jgi:TetR/AcrR family transcriptional repressor of nem operon